MIPIRSDVTQAVLSLLGDTQASGGSIFTQAFQAPHLNMAYQELFSKLSMMGAERIQRQGFYVLPAYTGVFTPSLAGLSNFGGPLEIRERGTVTTYAVSAATASSPSAGQCALTVAALPASVVTGAQAEVYNVGGLSDDVNDAWFLTVNSPTSIVLNGCASTGAYTSGGTLAYSTEQWSEMLDPKDSTDEFPSTASAALGMYSWQNGKIKFPSVSASRELRILYHLSASLPVSTQASGDSMGVDDSLVFLSNRCAQYAGASKGNTRAQACQNQADYFLAMMLGLAGKQLQESEDVVPAPFRSRRSVGPTIY